MLKQRVVTALILVVALLAAILWLPAHGFEALVFLVFAIGAWEWSTLSGVSNRVVRTVYVLAVVVAGLLLSRLGQTVIGAVLLIAVLWWFLALLLVWQYPRPNSLLNQPACLLLAGLLVLVPCLLAVRELELLPGDRRFYIVWFIALVASADIGAYFSGKAFGKTPLAPAVSPNKTWEGFCGGLLATSVVAIAGAKMDQAAALASVSTIMVVVAAALLAALSVVGDLFESLLKRQRNLKDSSDLLPGHGGVMDRLDSITAALPLYVLLLGCAVVP
jgi:phosphatidate cytidylyltransferase